MPQPAQTDAFGTINTRPVTARDVYDLATQIRNSLQPDIQNSLRLRFNFDSTNEALGVRIGQFRFQGRADWPDQWQLNYLYARLVDENTLMRTPPGHELLICLLNGSNDQIMIRPPDGYMAAGNAAVYYQNRQTVITLNGEPGTQSVADRYPDDVPAWATAAGMPTVVQMFQPRRRQAVKNLNGVRKARVRKARQIGVFFIPARRATRVSIASVIVQFASKGVEVAMRQKQK